MLGCPAPQREGLTFCRRQGCAGDWNQTGHSCPGGKLRPLVSA